MKEVDAKGATVELSDGVAATVLGLAIVLMGTFLGDALTVGFNFCAKDAPFRLTVMCIGGGGWLAAIRCYCSMISFEFFSAMSVTLSS